MGKYLDSKGREVEAYQFDASKPNKDVTKRRVKEVARTFDELTGKPEVEENEVEKFFIATKDERGDMSIKEPEASIADGMWVVTDQDGVTSICHPKIFTKQYKGAK